MASMNDLVLIKLHDARRMLAEAKTIQETKRIVDIAAAAEIYARRQQLGTEAVLVATSIKVEALRQLGEMLQATERNRGTWVIGRTIGGPIVEPPSDIPTLEDLGLDKKTSALAQQVAALPEEQIEAVKRGVVTIAQARKHARRERGQAARAASILPFSGSENIVVGDMRSIDGAVPAGGVDLILTDPPYLQEALPLYEDLSRLASRVLRPGGLCLAYSGQIFLPMALLLLGRYLEYLWMFAVRHGGGSNRIFKANVNCSWKPVLAFYKPPLGVWWDSFSDLTSGGREKDLHEWQQAEAEAAYFIEHLSPLNGLVLDPFAGSGTTLVAAKRLGRRTLGIEIDPISAGVAQRRIENGS